MSGEGVIIRTADPADEEQIRSILIDSIKELGREAYSKQQVDALPKGCASANYIPAIEGEDTELFVAEIDGEVRGFGTLKLTTLSEYEANVDAEITEVYIHPSVTRSGVGSRLYSTLERRAIEEGIEVLGLTASLNAVEFYANHGYERVREYCHEFSADDETGVTGTVVEMRKELERLSL